MRFQGLMIALVAAAGVVGGLWMLRNDQLQRLDRIERLKYEAELRSKPDLTPVPPGEAKPVPSSLVQTAVVKEETNKDE